MKIFKGIVALLSLLMLSVSLQAKTAVEIDMQANATLKTFS
jgi:hypothetical protein